MEMCVGKSVVVKLFLLPYRWSYDTTVANYNIFITSASYSRNNYYQNESSAEQECGVSIPCPERLWQESAGDVSDTGGFRRQGRVAAVAAKVRESGKKLQKNLTFFAVLLNNLTKNHAKLCTLFLYFPLWWNIFKKVTVGVILRRNDFLHPPGKFQKFTKRIVRRRKTFLWIWNFCVILLTAER